MHFLHNGSILGKTTSKWVSIHQIQKDPRQNRSARTSEPKQNKKNKKNMSYKAQIQMGLRKAHQICHLKRQKNPITHSNEEQLLNQKFHKPNGNRFTSQPKPRSGIHIHKYIYIETLTWL
jgi:hypothetical protein